MKSLTRIFAITLSFTITSKIDKDQQAKEQAGVMNVTTPFYYNTTAANSSASSDANSDFVHSSQTWSSSFWPFWIFASIFILLSITSLVIFIVQVF